MKGFGFFTLRTSNFAFDRLVDRRFSWHDFAVNASSFPSHFFKLFLLYLEFYFRPHGSCHDFSLFGNFSFMASKIIITEKPKQKLLLSWEIWICLLWFRAIWRENLGCIFWRRFDFFTQTDTLRYGNCIKFKNYLSMEMELKKCCTIEKEERCYVVFSPGRRGYFRSNIGNAM